MGIRDFIEKTKSKREKYKDFEEEQKMIRRFEEKSKSANERELERFMKEEREDAIKKELQEFREKRRTEIEFGNKILKTDNMFNKEDNQILKTVGMFSDKPKLNAERSLFFK